MTDEGLYSPTVTPCQDECHPVSVNIYCTLSLCKAATEVVNYTKSGWEHVVTLANEGETQWHSISTLASPFSLFTFLCGFAVTRSSLLICALWPLETPGHTHTLVFLFIFLWGLTVLFSKHWSLKSVKTPAAETNKLNPKSVTSSWTLKKNILTSCVATMQHRSKNSTQAHFTRRSYAACDIFKIQMKISDGWHFHLGLSMHLNVCTYGNFNYWQLTSALTSILSLC